MKAIIFISTFLISSISFSQFSEAFFDRLNTNPLNLGHFYGCTIPSGALGVNFADSVNTEVQWAKLDFQGNYQTFSSHLPNDLISPTERIIELYESGINQYVVTQDVDGTSPEGIRIHKFENYTENVGLYFLPMQLRQVYNQSYFKFGKIFIFIVDESNNISCLKINPATLLVEQNINMGNVIIPTQNLNKNYKKIHVLFEDENNMQFFTNSVGDLVRIKIANNIPDAIETNTLNIQKVFGVNESTNQIICLKSGLFEVKKYNLDFINSLSNVVLVDSLNVTIPNGPASDWIYANDNGLNELFYDKNGVDLFVINQSLGNIDLFNDNVFPTNASFINGKPILFGSKIFRNIIPTEDLPSLMITCGNINELNKFKEYGSVYDFGSYNTRVGLGSNIVSPINNSASGDYIFSRMIYNTSQIFSGKSNGEFYGASGLYYSDSYKPGPYTNFTQYSQDIIHQYNENFYVDIAMMDYHVYAIANNIATYNIPKGIKNWPAHGDESKGQAQNLAAFIDVNQNGIYEPLLGEYPSFPGTHCLLNITHQNEATFENLGSGLELHSYMYNFDCEDSLNEVVFLKTEVFNRGSRNYDSLASGIYTDFDLGGFNDDYIGTNIEKGLVYGYNGDSFDETDANSLGFLDSLPTIANLFLKGSKFSPNNTDDLVGVSSSQSVNGFGFNDGIIDNEYKTLEFSNSFNGSGALASQGAPTISEQFYNYLNGYWRFGDTVVFGGTGFPGSTNSTTIQSKYVFADASDPLHYGTNGIDPGFAWLEASNNNPAGDRRMIGSFGSTALNSGESVTYHSAILAGKRVPGMGQSQIDLFAKAGHVKNAFNNNLTSCGQTFDNLTQDQVNSVPKKMKNNLVKIYPNPSNDKFFIAFSDEQSNLEVVIYDINGKQMLNQSSFSLEDKTTSFDISSFEKGIYFVKIASDTFSETVKLVKN